MDTGQTVYNGNYKYGSASACTLMCAMDVHASVCILDFGTFLYEQRQSSFHTPAPLLLGIHLPGDGELVASRIMVNNRGEC